MTRSNWLRLFGSVVPAVLLFVFFSELLAIGSCAQSPQPANPALATKAAAPSPFLVAPSISLGYSPLSITAGDLRHSGKLDLVTADYSSGKVNVLLAAGPGNFAPAMAFDAGPHPASVQVVDIAGNGRPGVLVANDTGGTISVLAGNGDGTLRPRQSYSVGFNPSFLATGDFGGNGRMDVAVAEKTGNLLAVFFNDGNGNLGKPVVTSLLKQPTAIAVADFDLDGHADLALANADGTISVLLGKGAGLFHALPDLGIANGSLTAIVAGDFNKDGKADLAITQAGQNLTSVLLGKGDGTFTRSASYSAGNAPVSAIVADVDGDGVPDLVVISHASNTFSVLGGNGDGTFRNSKDFVAGNAPLAAVAGDFYGNGRADMAIVNYSSQSVSLPFANGDGTFKASRSYAAGQNPVSIASGNLDGSKTAGLVVANYCGSDAGCGSAGSVAVFLADSTGAYRLSSSYNVGAGPVSVSLADVNGDGKLDIVALNRLDKTLSILPGVGDGTFSEQITFALADAPLSVAAADFNKDGKPDLAVLEDCGTAKCAQPGSVEIMLGSGGGNFRSASTRAVGYAPVALAAGATFTGGNPDVVVASRCGQDASCKSGGTATVFYGDGSGQFKRGTDFALGNNPSSIALADLKGSGTLDLVVSRTSENAVAVLAGTGNGGFLPAVAYAVGNSPGALAVADFNGDGKADVAVANTADGTVSVLFGEGGGALQFAFSLPVAGNPSGLASIPAAAGCASLATTHGSASSLATGSNITVVPNVQARPFGVTANTVSLTATPSTSNVDEAVTLRVTVSGGSGTPTGSVDITGNGSPASICSALILDGTGAASCSTSALQTDTTSLTATYGGNPTYAVGTGTASVTVNPVASTIVFAAASPASPSALDTTVTFTVHLSGTLAPVPPSGQMTFLLNGSAATCVGQPGNSITVNAGGAASCQIQNMPAGTNNAVSASYSGDINYTVAAAASAPAYTITALHPAISFTPAASPASPSPVNTAVTFAAALGGTSLSPVVPNGKMTFLLNGSAATCVGAASNAITVNASGTAACQIQNMLVSTNSVVSASYSGDTNYIAASAASAPAYTTTKLTPTLNIDTSPSGAVSVGTEVTFTATLSASAVTPVAPAGTISFTINGASSSDCPDTKLVASLVATCKTKSLASPADTILAKYTLDPNFNDTQTATNVTVGTATAQIALTAAVGSSASAAPPASVYVNEPVTFKAVVSGASGASVPAPSGTVSFTQGPAALCTAPTLVPSTSTAGGVVTNIGTATCLPPYAFPSAFTSGTTITATFNPDKNFNSGTFATLALTVLKSPTSVGVVPSPIPPSRATQAVTFTATVTPTYTGTAVAGTVDFTPSVAGLNGCTGVQVTAAVNGTATAMCTVLVPIGFNGGFTVGAAYSGDPNYAASSANSPIQTVVSFSLALSAPSSGTAILTQGYASSSSPAIAPPSTPTEPTPTDPVAQTTITLTTTPLGESGASQFPDLLNLSCVPAPSSPVPAPICAVGASTAVAGSGALNWPVAIAAVDSTGAPVPAGAYSYQIVATDSQVPNLLQTVDTLVVYVAAKAGSLSLTKGASGTETVTLVPAVSAAQFASSSIASFSCGSIANLTAPAIAVVGITCSGPAVASTANPTTATITIATTGSGTAQVQRSNSIYGAAFMGLPLFALMGWIGSRKSPRKNFLRFLSLIVLILGLSFANGCGGGFVPPTASKGTGGTATGNYLVQVVGTDANGVKYYAVVPLTVN